MTLPEAYEVAKSDPDMIATLETVHNHGMRSWFIIDPYNPNHWPDHRRLTVKDALSDRWTVETRWETIDG